MSDVKFSIIIPVQNGAATIERLLASLIIQRSKIKEVLVCNDQSTDDTVEVVSSYNTQLPITVLNVPSEIGNNPGRARQVGLDHATGDWVVFADADDILTFNALGYYQSHIDKNPDVKMICAAFDEVNFDPFYVIEHISMPLAWVHSKAFNLQHIKEHGLRFHDVLYTHEDKYFTFLNIFDLRASGGADPIMEDATTYYWCRGQSTIVSRDKGLYPALSLIDSMDAMIEPAAIAIQKYGLDFKRTQELFGADLFGTILDCYQKIQASIFRWGENIVEQYNWKELAPQRINKIKELTGWTTEDLITIANHNPKMLNDARMDSVRTIGEYFQAETFYDFIRKI